MIFDPTTGSGRAAYELLTDCVVPRPVAWVTTLSPEGVLNLAPFSFFNGVCARPMVLSIAISSKPLGPRGARSFVAKDTVRNALHHDALVVHVAPASRQGEVSRTAEDHAAGTDVPALLGLDAVPGTFQRVPRLAGLPVALECRVERVVEVGDPVTHLLLARVLGVHVRDELVGEGGRVSTTWDPLARLGVDGYYPPR